MNPSREDLDRKLSKLEEERALDEHAISSAIKSLLNKDSHSEPCPEWGYEALAFSFMEDNQSKNKARDVYFVPSITRVTDDGRTLERPSLTEVTLEMIAYWSDRARQSSHPVMKARYAGLVWHLSRPVAGTAASHEFAVACCEAITELAESNRHEHDVEVIQHLSHALALAGSLRAHDLVVRCKRAILGFEARVGEDTKPGLWGFAYDLLVGNKAAALSEEEEQSIIDSLEARL